MKILKSGMAMKGFLATCEHEENVTFFQELGFSSILKKN
jgi:hypothetical protein